MAVIPDLVLRVAVEPDHVCPLAAVPEVEAVGMLVEILRATASASQVVARLGQRGVVLAREVGR